MDNSKRSQREQELSKWISTGTISKEFVRSDLGDPLRGVSPGQKIQVEVVADNSTRLKRKS